MPITRKKKEEIFEKLSAGLDTAKTVVFANFHGLTVGEVTELRKALREKGVNYMVAKKTLTKRVLGSKSYKGEVPSLDGELAIAWSVDEMAPPKGVAEFEKKFENRVSILGGIFEGEYKDKDAMKMLASIPSREVLLSQIAYLLRSPIQRLAIAVNEVSKKK